MKAYEWAELLYVHVLAAENKTVEALVTFAPAGSTAPFLSHPLPLIAKIAEALDVSHRVLLVAPDFFAAYVEHFRALKAEGFEAIATGDIEDVCSDFVGRAAVAASLPLLRPLWQVPRPTLLTQLFESYPLLFITTCVNTAKIPPDVARKMLGVPLTRAFITDMLTAALPNVDACGEGGEFHTMVLDAPLYKKRVVVEEGKGISDDPRGYMFFDIGDFYLEDKA
ncbi:hypothetical protein HDU87_003407 [Geranomyces variabilis]|uniref:Diphthine--ammonia ligase n=1 Tax=Geranomyces variabilis TaxID=109894 RepID=A0AAD5TM24_9FUNG|nr:hypothetical protein HDU87_003407 [Geranomyces variabilis]